MNLNPTEEIQAIRQELAERFNNDVHRIAAETRRRQQESGRTYLTLPKREPQLIKAIKTPSMQQGSEVK